MPLTSTYKDTGAHNESERGKKLTARLHLWNRSDPVFGIDLGTVLCPVYTIQSQLNYKHASSIT